MITFILCCVLCVLIVALVEAHDQAKRLAFIRAAHEVRIERILAENIALENKAQELVSNYGY
jgi:predicted DCC family thiol-disulfide oxidoreductase YuxK